MQARQKHNAHMYTWHAGRDRRHIDWHIPTLTTHTHSPHTRKHARTQASPCYLLRKPCISLFPPPLQSEL